MPTLDPSIRDALARRRDAVWVFDVEREAMVWANAPACVFWGARDFAELAARDFAGSMSEATRQRLRRAQETVDRGEIVREQWTLYPENHPRTIMLRGERAALSDGRGAVLFSLEQEVDGPVDALRGVEAVRHTTVMITLYDAAAMGVLYENPASIHVYGGTPAPLAERLVDPEEAERALWALRTKPSVAIEAQVQTANGTRWHSIDIRRATDPVTGGPAVLVNENDITESKRAAFALYSVQSSLEQSVQQRTAELLASRDFVDAVLDTVDSLILVANAKGTITRSNRRAGEVLDDALAGQSVWDITGVSPDTEAATPVEAKLGERLILWTITRPEELDHVVLTGIDITERRQLQLRLQLADRLASLGTLAAGVAHELNNPLTVIRANLEALRDGLPDNPHLLEAIRDCLLGTDQASRIVADLRAYSREDESARAIDVRALVDTALMLAAGTLHSVRLRIDVEPDLLVHGTEGPLTQVILNLLVNSAHADASQIEILASAHEERLRTPSPERGLPLSATLAKTSVRLIVRDNGSGIAAEDLARVFDPFFTTKPVGEGTGLGLFVCQRIVHSHGGSIRIQSAVGRGTSIVVTLPLGEATSETSAPRTDETECSGCVLVVDDDRGVLRALERLLRGYQVELAESGTEALEALRANPDRYVAVLSDLMMPEMSGVDLYQLVEAELPSVAARFVFMSGGLPHHSPTRAFLDSVSNPFLGKPFDGSALRRAIASLS
ncbi:MAG: ATP-binding protein [Myxococcota bacterium]